MTEDEAQTKWCPFARQTHASESGMIGAGQSVFNRLEIPGGKVATAPGSLCIASACMAWQARPQWRVRSDSAWLDGEPRGEFKGPNNQVRASGFCGLAGAPR